MFYVVTSILTYQYTKETLMLTHNIVEYYVVRFSNPKVLSNNEFIDIPILLITVSITQNNETRQ